MATIPSSIGWRSASSRPLELRELVEEEHTAVSERRLARPRTGAASDNRSGRRAVVRRAKRRVGDQRPFGRDEAGDGMDTRHLERLGRLEGGQDARESTGEHRLARSRRPREEEIVPSCCGDLERAPRAFVTAHLGKIRQPALGRCSVSLLPVELRLAAQVGHRFREVPHRDRLDAGERCFGGRVGGTQQLVDRRARRALRDREDPADPAQPPVEAELADRRMLRKPLGRDLPGRRQDCECDRQVEPGAFLPELRRREIHGNAPVRPIELGRSDAAPDPVLRFLHSAVDEPDDGEGGNAALDMHLNVDPARLEADEGMRDRAREHVATLDDEE